MTLSKRQIQVLEFIAKGHLKKQIADELGIGVSTVVTHVNELYKRLGAVNAPSAVSNAYQQGILITEREQNPENPEKTKK